MIALIFEVIPKPGCKPAYLDIAASLRPLLDGVDGFISVERFQSLSNPDKLLSLSYWRDETALAAWRATEEHRQAQAVGRNSIFQEYRLKVCAVMRDYGRNDRAEAPADSRRFHG